jgi:O-antigen/teichoic acid export membrane protein
MNWFSHTEVTASLRGRSVAGLSATFAAQGIKFASGLVGTALLARMLDPSDFGLVAMVLSVAGVAHIFKDFGLSAATVQCTHLDPRNTNTVFWLSVGLGAFLSIALAALAPVVAWAFKAPETREITVALSSIFLLGAVGNQHIALLRRHLLLIRVNLIEVGGILVGLASALLAAWKGMGPWALVIQQLIQTLAISILAWVACSWRPSFPSWSPQVLHMVKFGGSVALSNFMAYLARNLDAALVGRFAGAAALGLYSKAYQLLLMPIKQINTPASTVFVPALSRLQDNPTKFRTFYDAGILLVTSLGMPCVVFMFFQSESIIRIVLGERWLDAAPLFRLLAVGAFFDTFNIAGGWVMMALGQSKKQAIIAVASGVVFCIAFLIGIQWGAAGMAAAVSCAIFVTRLPAIAYAYHGTFLKLRNFATVIFRPAAAALAASAIFLLPHFGNGARESVIEELMVVSLWFVAYGLVYSCIWFVIPGGRQTITKILTAVRATGGKGAEKLRC